MTKKVAILGYASNWKEAPFDDLETEIWVQNIAEITKSGFPRFTKVFDIHSYDIILAEARDSPAGLKVVIENNYPVYLQEHVESIRNSIELPLDILSREFFPWSVKLGKWKYDDVYWTSSTQMMIALAIHERYEEIGIYGVDMADSDEYRGQRRGCEYMLGIAFGRGITIKRSSSSPVLRTKYVYGYDLTEEKAYRQ